LAQLGGFGKVCGKEAPVRLDYARPGENSVRRNFVHTVSECFHNFNSEISK
jgi:hypothetical protein